MKLNKTQLNWSNFIQETLFFQETPDKIMKSSKSAVSMGVMGALAPLAFTFEDHEIFERSSSEDFKVHIFWEGHKILRNLHQLFDWYYIRQIIGGDFAKFCGLLRIYELYKGFQVKSFPFKQIHQFKQIQVQKCC